VTNTTDDNKSSDPGSQADELTEMWDASALDAAAAEFQAASGSQPATAPVRRDEPSIQVDTAAVSPRSAPRPKRKKKRGLASASLPVQLALAVFVAVATFGLVKLLLAN
jgi:hypothetical protein